MNYVLEKGGGGPLSLCALISPDSSESDAKTLLYPSFALAPRPLPLHGRTTYWPVRQHLFFPFSQILFFALVCCRVVHDDEFAPVVFLLITCCYCGEDKQWREERRKQ